MRIKHVTFTGADDSVDPQKLVEFSRVYPQVEWGILVSKSSMGSPRFPSSTWFNVFREVAEDHQLNVSLHLCGQWLRRLLLGDLSVIQEIGIDNWFAFQRVQLNFHAEELTVNRERFFQTLGSQKRQFIFQVDGNMGGELLKDYLTSRANASPLFDLSHGTGVSPDEWPEPDFGHPSVPVWHGYAGGLGPDNLADELCRIHDAARSAPVWVDMETKVRNRHDEFDLSLCSNCMEQVESFESMAVA